MIEGGGVKGGQLPGRSSLRGEKVGVVGLHLGPQGVVPARRRPAGQVTHEAIGLALNAEPAEGIVGPPLEVVEAGLATSQRLDQPLVPG